MLCTSKHPEKKQHKISSTAVFNIDNNKISFFLEQ